MGERGGESATTSWPSAAPIVLACAAVTAAGVLQVAPIPDGSGTAAATVGVVLAEAIVLNVGYGALVRVADRAARERRRDG